MRIFISWSGELSHGYAQAFREWLPSVIQSVDPFISSQDIALGQRGIEEIESRLNEISFGVLFVTSENQAAPWLLYEAGALSRSIDNSEARVIPILIDISRSELTGSPISHFQNADSATKETFKRLLFSINEYSNAKLDAERMEQSFEKWWPDLQEMFSKIKKPEKTIRAASLEDISSRLDDLSRAIVELRNNERQQSSILGELLEHLPNYYSARRTEKSIFPASDRKTDVQRNYLSYLVNSDRDLSVSERLEKRARSLLERGEDDDGVS